MRLIVGGIVMAFAAVTMIMIPHPMWFMIASPLRVVPPGAGRAVWLAKTLFNRSGLRAPSPTTCARRTWPVDRRTGFQPVRMRSAGH